MGASIRDIADRAGVAASTVSRVINGSQQYRISDETSERVWKAVRELNYQVDHVARQIIRRRWHGDKTRGGIYRIGVVHMGFSNELASSYYYDIIFGIQAEILERRMVLAGLYDVKQIQDERLLFHATDPVEVDGLLMFSGITGDLDRRIRERVATTVRVGGEDLAKQDSVTFDHHDAMMLMVRHLAGLGHRRIGYMGRPDHGNVAAPSQARTQGYLDAMAEQGLSVAEGYIIDTADARRTGFQSQLDQFMAFNPRPTAMACASDRVCIEFMRRLIGAGLRVPDDVALGGFEDLDVASIMIPRLTTIHAPRQELGREAVRLLIQRLDNPDAPVEHRVLKTSLVVRESCGSGKG